MKYFSGAFNGHLQEILYHTTLQKVRGFVEGLTGLWGENNNDYNRKILLCLWTVKVKIVSSRHPYFMAKIVDYQFKSCILYQNAGPWILGRITITLDNVCIAKFWL